MSSTDFGDTWETACNTSGKGRREQSHSFLLWHEWTAALELVLLCVSISSGDVRETNYVPVCPEKAAEMDVTCDIGCQVSSDKRRGKEGGGRRECLNSRGARRSAASMIGHSYTSQRQTESRLCNKVSFRSDATPQCALRNRSSLQILGMLADCSPVLSPSSSSNSVL